MMRWQVCGSSVLISKKVTCKSFKKVMIDILPVFVCVLTGLWTRKYDQIMRWWSSKPQLGVDTVLDYVTYGYVLPHWLPWYYSPQLSYHMRSFYHLGIAHICISISTYRMRSSYHLGVSCLCPSIPTSRSTSLPPTGSYCVALSPYCLLLLDSHEIYAKVYLSWFYASSWCHHTYLPIKYVVFNHVGL